MPQLRCAGCADDCTKCKHAAYRCYVFVNGNAKTRDMYIKTLTELGLPCQSGSCSEVYLEKAFDGTRFRPERRLKNAKKLGESSIAFMCHPTITDDQMSKVCDTILKVF